MTGTDWSDRSALAVAVYLDGSDEPDRAADGTPMLNDDFLVLVNAWWQPPGFTMPPAPGSPGRPRSTPTIPPEPPEPPVRRCRAGDQLTVGPGQSSFRGPLTDDDGPV